MVKVIHAFVTSENKDLKQLYDTLEIFYWRFNPDREFNYVGLDKSTSKPIIHQDPDYILEVLTNNNHADRKLKYNITIESPVELNSQNIDFYKYIKSRVESEVKKSLVISFWS